MTQAKVERLKKLLGKDFPERLPVPESVETTEQEQLIETKETSPPTAAQAPPASLVGTSERAVPQTTHTMTVREPPVTKPSNRVDHSGKSSASTSSRRPLRPFRERTVLFDTHDPGIGRLSEIGTAFCPINAVSKYPYKFVPQHLAQEIAEEFFDDGKFWYREWDVYYVWPSPEQSPKPLLVVQAEQVEQFLQEINHVVGSYLVLGNEAEEFGLVLKFPDHPNLRPRYLGRSTTREMFTVMEKKVPNSEHFPNGELKPSNKPDRTTLDDWKYMIQLAFDVCKTKNKAAKAAKKDQRIKKQQQWKDGLKRAEKFLGFRPAPSKLPELAPGASWEQDKAFHDAQNKPPEPLQPVTEQAVPPYPFDQEPVFVSIDVECYEHDKSKVTEIGIAILDTVDLAGKSPGTNGIDWQRYIRARHLRIRDNSHLRNGDFVADAAENFRYPEGGSEFINLADAPRIIAACFRHPYCKDLRKRSVIVSPMQESSGKQAESEKTKHRQGTEHNVGQALSDSKDQEPVKRTLVLVGHDIASDIRYLRRVGYDLGNLSNLHTTLDTTSLHRALVDEWNPKSLSGILGEFDLDGFFPHNAGNDAVHTLWVMFAIVLKSATQRGDAEVQKRHGEQMAKRTDEAVG